MTTLDFLKEKLSSLAKKFPDVTIRYGFDDQICRHIVELTPEYQYYSNSPLDESWIEISIEFMNTFPSECISFVSDDSTLRVHEATLEFNIKWSNIPLVQVSNPYGIINLNFFPINTSTPVSSTIFDNYKAQLPGLAGLPAFFVGDNDTLRNPYFAGNIGESLFTNNNNQNIFSYSNIYFNEMIDSMEISAPTTDESATIKIIELGLAIKSQAA